MRIVAKTAFHWCFCIGNKNELELNDNVDFSKVLKADKHIRVYTAYLDSGLWLPLGNFSYMILVYYGRAISQYTTHFLIMLSILEDIDNTIGYGPFYIDNIRTYFYVKAMGSYYMMFKWANKKHVCLFPNKTKYENSAYYKVGGKYC